MSIFTYTVEKVNVNNNNNTTTTRQNKIRNVYK